MDRIEAVVSWLADRLQEKSTYVGLAALLGALGFALAPDAVSHYANVGLAVGGLLSILVKDKQ